MTRKREDLKTTKQLGSKEQNKSKPLATYIDDGISTFNKQLSELGLALRIIPGDGNCLFRAFGDQLEGHGRNHMKHRQDTVNYMKEHREDFEPFVEDDKSFDYIVGNLAKHGKYAGNDAIVAFARLHKVTIVIHQLNTPLWRIEGTVNEDIQVSKMGMELHISYHNGDHYNSVRKLGDHSETPANIRLQPLSSQKLGHRRVKSDSGKYNDARHSQSSTRDYKQFTNEDESDISEDEKAISKINQLHINGDISKHNQKESHSSVNGEISNSEGERLPNSQGAKPKDRSQNNSSIPVKPLTNRQIKEQKKKERKKNSEERKRLKELKRDGSKKSDEESAVEKLGWLTL